MEHKHLDLDGLLQASYGLESDVGQCPECRAAVERMTRQRREPRVEEARAQGHQRLPVACRIAVTALNRLSDRQNSLP